MIALLKRVLFVVQFVHGDWRDGKALTARRVEFWWWYSGQDPNTPSATWERT